MVKLIPQASEGGENVSETGYRSVADCDKFSTTVIAKTFHRISPGTEVFA